MQSNRQCHPANRSTINCCHRAAPSKWKHIRHPNPCPCPMMGVMLLYSRAALVASPTRHRPFPTCSFTLPCPTPLLARPDWLPVATTRLSLDNVFHAKRPPQSHCMVRRLKHENHNKSRGRFEGEVRTTERPSTDGVYMGASADCIRSTQQREGAANQMARWAWCILPLRPKNVLMANRAAAHLKYGCCHT